MAFNPLTTPIDYFLLSGQPSPGLATITGDGPEQRWDPINGPGLSGAVPIFKGQALAEFTAEIRLTTDQDWADWESFKTLVAKPPYGKRPRAHDIWHPWCVEAGVTSAVVRNVSMPRAVGDGVFVVTIKFLQFRKLKIALAKPEAAAPSAITDPYDLKIDGLMKQLAEENAKGLAG